MEYLFIDIIFRSLSTRRVVPIRVRSMCLIDLFKNCKYTTGMFDFWHLTRLQRVYDVTKNVRVVGTHFSWEGHGS